MIYLSSAYGDCETLFIGSLLLWTDEYFVCEGLQNLAFFLRWLLAQQVGVSIVSGALIQVFVVFVIILKTSFRNDISRSACINNRSTMDKQISNEWINVQYKSAPVSIELDVDLLDLLDLRGCARSWTRFAFWYNLYFVHDTLQHDDTRLYKLWRAAVSDSCWKERNQKQTTTPEMNSSVWKLHLWGHIKSRLCLGSWTHSCAIFLHNNERYRLYACLWHLHSSVFITHAIWF